jgi:hypothetical protein
MEDTAVTTIGRKAAGAALASFAGAAGCGVEALRTHLLLSSLGPICGLDRPALFFLHCPACPAGLILLAAGMVFGGLALHAPTAASMRQASASALSAKFPAR